MKVVMLEPESKNKGTGRVKVEKLDKEVMYEGKTSAVKF